MLSLMNSKSITSEEFLKSFKNVITFVTKTTKAIDKKNEMAVENLNDLFNNLETKLTSSTKTDVSGAIKEVRTMVDKALRDQQAGMNLINDKLSKIRNGLDADENKIVEKVLKLIPEQKETILDTAEMLRNKLEKLVGDQRIDWKSIRGLDEEMSKRNVGKTFIGGGVSKISMDRFILDPYIPSGTINGSNTDFVLLKTPNPTASLKVWLGGALQSLTDDYTISGKTITLTSKTPQTNEILKVEHRI